jgi:hypothetical protein
MTKRDAIQTVRVEVLRTTQERKRTPAEAAEIIKKLVEKQVAEILANRDEFLIRPFFDSQKIAAELRRLQSVPEHLAWRKVFEKYGCIVCGRKNVSHGGCGCCELHYKRIRERKVEAIRELERVKDAGRGISFDTDDSEIARQAFAEPMKALPPANSRRRAGRSR